MKRKIPQLNTKRNQLGSSVTLPNQDPQLKISYRENPDPTGSQIIQQSRGNLGDVARVLSEQYGVLGITATATITAAYVLGMVPHDDSEISIDSSQVSLENTLGNLWNIMAYPFIGEAQAARLPGSLDLDTIFDLPSQVRLPIDITPEEIENKELTTALLELQNAYSSSGIIPSFDLQEQLKKINEIDSALTLKLDKKEKKLGRKLNDLEFAGLLDEIVRKDFGFTYELTSFLSEGLAKGKLDCDTYTELYITLAKRHGREAHLVSVPDHAFLGFKDFLWESTNGRLIDEELYQLDFAISSSSIENGVFLTPLNKKRIIARNYAYLGYKLLNKTKSTFDISNNLEMARTTAKKAIELDDKCFEAYQVNTGIEFRAISQNLLSGFDMGAYKRFVTNFEKLIELTPDDTTLQRDYFKKIRALYCSVNSSIKDRDVIGDDLTRISKRFAKTDKFNTKNYEKVIDSVESRKNKKDLDGNEFARSYSFPDITKPNLDVFDSLTLFKDVWFNGDDNELAKVVLDKLEEIHSDNFSFKAYAANVAVTEKDYEKALGLLDELIEEKPLGIFYVAKGIVHLEMGEVEKALGFYEEAKKIKPIGVAASALGKRLKKEGYPDLALEELIESSEKFPSIPNLRNLGLLFSELGQFEKAEKVFKKALEMDSDDVSLLEDLEQLYSQTGRKIDELETTQKIIASLDHKLKTKKPRLFNRRDGTLYQQGVFLMELGKPAYGAAKKYFEVFLAKNKNHTGAREKLSEIYIATGKYDDAQKILIGLMREKPGNTAYRRQLSDIALGKGRLDVAYKISEKAIDYVVGDSISLARAFEKRYQTTKNVGDVLKAVEMFAYWNATEAHSILDEIKVKKSSDKDQVNYLRAFTFYHQKKLDKAFGLLFDLEDNNLKTGKEDANVYALIAKCYERKKDKANYVNYGKKAIALDPKLSEQLWRVKYAERELARSDKK